jgi:ATP-binding cassette, subfamily B, bacterial
VFDLRGPQRQRQDAPPLPHLVLESLRLAWRAGRRELIVIVAIQAVTIVGVLALVLVTRSLLSGVLHGDRANENVGSVVPEILALGGLTAGLGVAQAIASFKQRILTEVCTRYAEDRVLAVTGSVELAAFDAPDFHDAAARALAAVTRMPAVIFSLSSLVRALAISLGAFVGLIALQPAFAAAVAFVLVPSWLAARQRGRAFYRFAIGLTPQDRERRYLAHTLSDRDAAKEVRAFGLNRFLRARHDRLWEERLAELRRVASRQLRVSVASDLAASTILAGTLLALVALTLSDHIGLADAGATAGAIVLLGQRLTMAAASTGGLSESALFMDDYLAFVALDRPDSAEAPAGTDPTPPLHVRADGVTFSYAGARRHALHDVSLDVSPGEVVALVGENGSGKTTLAKLLAGLYQPEAGRVTWNGVTTASAGREELRRSVAVIFQDFLRYALPARDNIALGRHENFADDAGVHRAARIAGAHENIQSLPEGYDTMLGPAFEGGTDLSLGQWQRVALARALFRDAPFVILDEPTAALDAQAEHELFAGIRELLVGRTVLLISHRFSSVREADRIHVMQGGTIIESGTHDELIERGGRYAELFYLQAAPYR